LTLAAVFPSFNLGWLAGGYFILFVVGGYVLSVTKARKG
jgi:hypothetical protein